MKANSLTLKGLNIPGMTFGNEQVFTFVPVRKNDTFLKCFRGLHKGSFFLKGFTKRFAVVGRGAP